MKLQFLNYYSLEPTSPLKASPGIQRLTWPKHSKTCRYVTSDLSPSRPYQSCGVLHIRNYSSSGIILWRTNKNSTIYFMLKESSQICNICMKCSYLRWGYSPDVFGDSQACLHFIPLILKINSPSVHFYFYEHNPTFQISSSFLNVYNNIFVVVCLFFWIHRASCSWKFHSHCTFVLNVIRFKIIYRPNCFWGLD